MLSWQRHGVALTTCELGNFPLRGNFLTEARFPPRKTERLLISPAPLPPLCKGEQVLSWQRHGVALTICELGNGTWSVPFQGSRADAKQMRGKRSSAGSTARDGGLPKTSRRGCRSRPLPCLPCVRGGGALSEDLSRQQAGGVVDPPQKAEGVNLSLKTVSAVTFYKFIFSKNLNFKS